MNTLAGADAEVVLAFGADLQVLVQLLVKKHRAALRVGALGPEALGDVAFSGFGPTQLGLFHKGRFFSRGRRSDRGFGALESESLFGEGSGGHKRIDRMGNHVE